MEIVPNDRAYDVGYSGTSTEEKDYLRARIDELDARLELCDLKDDLNMPRVWVQKVSNDIILIRANGCKFRSVQMRDKAEAVDFSKHQTCVFERDGMKYSFLGIS